MNSPQSFNSVTNDSRENNPLNPPLLRGNSSGAPFIKGESMIRQQHHSCPVCNAQLNGVYYELLVYKGKWYQTFQEKYMPKRMTSESTFRGFYGQGLITDVLNIVKSGKEATIYRCQAHPSTGNEFLVAKVYRPFIHRSFRNDAIYQRGRFIRDERSQRPEARVIPIP